MSDYQEEDRELQNEGSDGFEGYPEQRKTCCPNTVCLCEESNPMTKAISDSELESFSAFLNDMGQPATAEGEGK